MINVKCTANRQLVDVKGSSCTAVMVHIVCLDLCFISSGRISSGYMNQHVELFILCISGHVFH